MKPRLLDLFCGAGGTGAGYAAAGFEVVGVDNQPQKHYPFEFHQGDAMTFPLDGFDAVHASPPCQAHCALNKMHNAKQHVSLIAATRERLRAWGGPYVIENVVGAPLIEPVLLCGTMFGLGCSFAELQRHRLFESNVPIAAPSECRHNPDNDVIGIYGGHKRNRKRTSGDRGHADFTIQDAKWAMGIDWMTLNELSQAIPPAYTRHIGLQLIKHLEGKMGAATAQEPAPIPNEGTPVWREVIEDMQARDDFGREKYGTPLQTFNGRNPAVDKYQEALDLAVYFKQDIIERAKIEAVIREVSAVLAEVDSYKIEHSPLPMHLVNKVRTARASIEELRIAGA